MIKAIRDRNIKDKKWLLLANELKRTVDVVKKRWKTLRDRFFRHYKKERNTSSGMGQRSPSEEGGDKYKYYNQMLFLCEAENVNERTSGNFDNTASFYESFVEELVEDSTLEAGSSCEKISPGDNSTGSSSSSRMSTPTETGGLSGTLYNPPKRRRMREHILEQNTHKSMIDLINSAKSQLEKPSPVKAFFDSIALQVENTNLSSEQFASLQIKAIQALQEEVSAQNREMPSTSRRSDFI